MIGDRFHNGNGGLGIGNGNILSNRDFLATIRKMINIWVAKNILPFINYFLR